MGTNYKNRRSLTVKSSVSEDFYMACCKGEGNTAQRIMIEHSINVKEWSYNGYSALHMACIARDVGLMEEIVKRGADIKRVDNNGNTAFHIACLVNRLEVMESLIKMGFGIKIDGANTLYEIFIKVCEEAMKNILSKGSVGTLDMFVEKKEQMYYKKEMEDILERKLKEYLYIECSSGNVKKAEKILSRISPASLGDTMIVKLINDSGNKVVDFLINNFGSSRISRIYPQISEDKKKVIMNKMAHEFSKKDKINKLPDEALVNLFEVSPDKDLELLINRVWVERLIAVFSKLSNRVCVFIIKNLSMRKSEVYGKLNPELRQSVDEYWEENAKEYQDKESSKSVENDQELIVATKLGYEKKVKKLSKSNSNLKSSDTKGKNALVHAIEQENLDIVNILLGSGIDVNARDKMGKTAIMYAIIKGNVRIVSMLINSGAELYVADKNGKTVLMYALEKGESMAFLIDNIIEDYGYKYGDKNTIFMYACKGGYEKAVKRLIKYGANVNAIDIYGNTPISTAFNNGNKVLTELLIKSGALEEGRVKDRNRFHIFKQKVFKGRGVTENESGTKKEYEEIKSCELQTADKDSKSFRNRKKKIKPRKDYVVQQYLNI